MDPAELVSHIRNGNTDQAIAEFLLTNPGVTLENLAVSAVDWGMDDVTEPVLRALLKEQPHHLAGHEYFGLMLARQNRYAESGAHFEILSKAFPTSVHYYNALCWAYFYGRRLGALRTCVRRAQKNVPDGIHLSWQAGISPNNFFSDEEVLKHQELGASRQVVINDQRRTNHEHTHTVTWQPQRKIDQATRIYRLFGASKNLDGATACFLVDDQIVIPATSIATGDVVVWVGDFTPIPGTLHCIRLQITVGDAIKLGNDVELTCPQTNVAYAETRDATEIGKTGLTLSGIVAGSGTSAQFRFEFGNAPNDLKHRTGWQSVPGNLNARIRSSPHEAPINWRLYAGAFSLESHGGSVIMCDWPFGKDPNHISGIGFIELMAGFWQNSCQPEGNEEIQKWESSDIRDATITVKLRAEDFDPKDFLYCLGVGNVHAYWILTGQPLDMEHRNTSSEVEFRAQLPSNPSAWTFAGNNPIEQKDFDRYGYDPINETLSQNVGNIAFVAPFGDWRDSPTGRLGLREVELTYRDKSVLHPDAGAQLISFPSTSFCDPMNLTNGNRGNADDGWFQVTPITAPLIFTWKLIAPQKLTTIVLHQDVFLPVKRCRVTIAHGTAAIPSQSGEYVLPHETSLSIGPPVLVIRLREPTICDEISIELMEAAGPAGIGLTAVEAFAKEYSPPPSAVPVSVSADVGDLSVGTEIFYRLVCRSAGKKGVGEVKAFTLPANEAPLLHSADVHSVSRNKAIFRVRGNAMGHKTTVNWRIDDELWQEIPMGWENTAVDRYITVREMRTGDHSFSVCLMSDAGKSKEQTIYWKVDG